MGKEKTQFKKGQSGNPGGRIKLPEDVKQAKNMNRVELERTLNRLVHMTPMQLKEILNAPNTPVFEVMIAQIVTKAAQQGDHMRLNFLLDRMVGKVKEHIEHTIRKPVAIQRRDGTEVVFTDKEQNESN